MSNPKKRIDSILDLYPDADFLQADGFDEALIGVEPSTHRLIYSSNKCIEILITKGMTEDEAIEYFDYNVAGSYMGEQTPIWCDDITEVE